MDPIGSPPLPVLAATAGGAVDVAPLVAHVRRLVPVLTDVDERAVDALLATADATERLRVFAGDPQRPVLVFVACADGPCSAPRRDHRGAQALTVAWGVGEGAHSGATGEERAPLLSVQLDMTLPDQRLAAVAFVKRAPTLDVARPLAGQLQLLNMGDGSPSEVLHAYIRNAVAPFFNAYANKVAARSGATEREARTGIPAVRKKMAELEVSLLNLQQNRDIPTVMIQLHPAVQTIVTVVRVHSR
jgi:dynein heavy chain 1, cytosolic